MPSSILYTFVAITSLMGCLMSFVLFFLKRSYPESIKGLDDWAFFPLLSFFASALYGMQGKWHHLVSMALPNLLLVITSIMQLRGTFKHFGKPVNTNLILVTVGIAIVPIIWWSGKNEYFSHRLIMMSGLTAAMFGMQVKLLWGKRRDSFAAHFMLMTLVLLCAVMMARVTSALIDPPPVGLFTYSPLQAIYLASYSFGVLLLSISAILLSSEQLRNEMAKLLKFDALTGALTRRAAFEYGEDELARSSRSGTVFSLLLMDLDHFKEINDKYGHQKGDEVLTQFVQRIEQVLRRPSVIGRYGGEEFIVLLPDTNKEKAVQVAERIQDHLRASTAQAKVTASIGVTSFSKARGDTLDAMIGRADAALYAAKNNGRDQIVVDEML